MGQGRQRVMVQTEWSLLMDASCPFAQSFLVTWQCTQSSCHQTGRPPRVWALCKGQEVQGKPITPSISLSPPDHLSHLWDQWRHSGKEDCQHHGRV